MRLPNRWQKDEIVDEARCLKATIAHYAPEDWTLNQAADALIRLAETTPSKDDDE